MRPYGLRGFESLSLRTTTKKAPKIILGLFLLNKVSIYTLGALTVTHFILSSKMKHILLFFLLSLSLIYFPMAVDAQDTLRIDLSEFIEMGMEKSGQAAYERAEINLAENRAESARGQRFLPSIQLNTQHGVIPGVTSDTDLPRNEFYLDPNLSNDWEDWAVFTRAELSAVQPIYTWGAIDNAISAAESAVRASEFEYEAKEAEIMYQYYELYYSYLLAKEMSRLLDDAQSQLNQIERQIRQMQEDGDPDLKEADIFKFEIFEAEFQVQKVEVEQSLRFVERVWSRALNAGDGVVYMPAESFLDPVPFELQDYEYYEEQAMQTRPELRGVESGIEAVERSVEATRAQYLPSLFLGITGSYANTPNRPRQSNPFIINSTNYASAAVGISIRQNLNFSGTKRSVERAQIEHRRMHDLKDALSDGVVLDLNEKYREAVIAETKLHQTEKALTTARNWVRHEQLNYDIGFGDVEDLTDAIRQELETRLELKQNVFDLNKRVAELYKSSGMPILQLSVN